jgi:taurine dioxygenase
MNLRITPLTGKIGADVHGLDMSQPLGPDDHRAVHQALLDHQVLFFREQKLLTVERHKELAASFGELEIAPFLHDASDPTVMLLDQTDPKGSQAANFHADNTFRPYPPMGAFLQAHQIPDAGGDTCFASMHAAYQALSDRMKAYLEGLEAWHSLAQMTARLASHGMTSLHTAEEFPPYRHPVIATHPETGRKLINVNYNWTTEIAGLPPAESRMILDFLYEHIKSPEFQVRLRWNAGDIAFWDNRAVQHYAVPDWTGRRVMQRVAIAGAAA